MLPYLLIFVFGTFVGSFLNVLIDRLARGETVVLGRSYCEKCHHQLAWNDLIPIGSYLFLRGRCRYCHSPIPFWLPLVEATTGLLFVLITLVFRSVVFDFSFNIHYLIFIIYYFTISSFLLVIFFSDLKYHLIYDGIVYAALGITLLYYLFVSYSPAPSYQPPAPNYHLLSSLLAAAFFYLLYLAGPKIFHREAMGLGDVKLAGLMGLLLGYPGIIIALYIAFLTGALVGVILMLIKRAKMQSQIAFGPFLVLATLIVWFWGERVWGLVAGIW